MLLMGKSTISMPMFNSYVKLPEGTVPYPPKITGPQNREFNQKTLNRKTSGLAATMSSASAC